MTSIPAVLDDALGFNVYRAASLFRRELLQALSGYSLTPEQWQIMQALWATGTPLNQSQVAELTLRDRHSVSRILARLERDHWIARHPDPDDARALLVEPTQRADALRDEVRRVLFDHFDRLLAPLAEDEEKDLLRQLKLLRRLLGDDA